MSDLVPKAPAEVTLAELASPPPGPAQPLPGPRFTGTILDYEMARGAPGDLRERGLLAHAPGVASAHPVGVLYQGPFEQAADGFHEHVRRNARALSESGCPVQLRSFKPQTLAEGADAPTSLEHARALMKTSVGRLGCVVHQLVPSAGALATFLAPSQMAMRGLGADDLERLFRCKAVYTVWERAPVPPDDARMLESVGQAWVACHDNARRLVEAGVSPARVRVVPIPVFPDDPLLALDGRPRVPGVPRFYHVGKWEPRKDQHRMIGCFLRAFKKGEAELYLKTSRYTQRVAGYPEGTAESVKHWMSCESVQRNGWVFPTETEPKLIGQELGKMGLKIYETRVSDGWIRDLHRHGDVYVSLSHGEGFDMPAFDAKVSGNLLVYTPSGGPQDFSGERDSRVPEKDRVPCHRLYGWPEGSHYLDYDDDDAELALRGAHEQVLAGLRARGMSLGPFTAEVVGRQMLGHLRELADNLPGGG